MKHIIEFDLPDDKESLDIHNNAVNYYCALHDLMNMIRLEYKHGDSDAKFSIGLIRKRFWQVMEDKDVDLL